MNEQRTHIDLFSGIGGFALAANAAGFRTSVFCEQDDYCAKVLRRHWPNVPIIPDVKEFDGTRWKGADLLTGGFPCQPFSNAGLKLGKEDNDRYLWPEMFRVIKEARPRFVLAENVTPLIRLAIDEVLSDLGSEGYTTGTVVLPACALNAPHRRPRCWILAHSNSERGCGGKRERKYAADAREPSGSPELRQWDTEPAVGRVAHGIPHRTHRLKALGNSIVPQVAYEILKLI